ncbi:MAG: hypothetical protein IJJ23_03730 [Clostridia bacterium]|nr:hypothetical protein [Clostridia bacterium]
MTRNETIQLLALLTISYPRFAFEANEQTVSIWHDMLKDLPGEAVILASKRMISTLKFPPTIADIREAVASSVQDARGTVNAGEAWRKVTKAISDYGYYQPDLARAYLGEDVWRAVEYIGGWADLCTSEEPITVRSAQFERRYTAMVQQQGEAIQIPSEVRDAMKRLTEPLADRLAITD